MASSIYVYDNMKEFERFYKGFLDEPMKKINIVDMYINDKSKLWIVTNTNQEKERPRLQKSLVHFRNGNIYGYQDDKTTLVIHNKIKFNKKKMQLEFFPKFLRKPMLSWRVDRHFESNNPNKNKIIDYDMKFYDYEMDRINFILKND